MNLYENFTFDRLPEQISDLQRDFFYSWTSLLPNYPIYGLPNFRKNLEKAFKYQEIVTINTLELQAQLTRIYVDTQKEFLREYFKMLRQWG
jgi:hypothetical protein